METAVEFLIQELFNNGYFPYGVPEDIVNKAKEMEKEQMCKFASDYVETQCSASFEGSVSVDMTTEEYYNLTFKSE